MPRGSPADRRRIQALFVEHNVRFDHTAAFFTAGDPLGIFHILRIIKRMTVHTVIPQNASVKFIYLPASCRLMQSVDILCHNRG